MNLEKWYWSEVKIVKVMETVEVHLEYHGYIKLYCNASRLGVVEVFLSLSTGGEVDENIYLSII